MQQLKSGSLLQGGKYRIEKVLGQGGFGITYLATQELLDRKVCIKEFFFKEYCERDETTSHVTLGTQANRELVERFMNKFLKEARTISQLDHRNIIKIHDIFKENNTAYYVMDYVEGESLNELVNRRGALPEKEAVEYIERVADALKYIHERNINHLDIKPSNIMIRKEDYRVILIDFGLSKQYDSFGDQTSTTPVGISHGYAPMEQYKQGGVSTFSPQTDIYSLGATLYKLVTGNTPPQAMDIFNDGLSGLPHSLSSNLSNAIINAMQPKRNDRPQNINDFISFLQGQYKTCSDLSIGQNKFDESTKIIDIPNGDLTINASSTQSKQTIIEPPKYNAKGRIIGYISIAFMSIVLLFFWNNNKDTSIELKNNQTADELFNSAMKYWHKDDFIHAKPLFEMAAERGHVESEVYLGLCYIGTKEDVSKGLNILRELAEEGNVFAQINLGFIYDTGFNVEKNEQIAFYWWYKAAECEDATAQFNIAMCFYYGKGVTKNLQKAKLWLEKSATQGYEEAKTALASLNEEKRINEQERLAEVRRQEQEATAKAEKEKQEREAEYSSTHGSINGHEFVDLGLSVKWATCNVGASSPTDYGDYFAWGETIPKTSYGEENSVTFKRNLGDIAGNSHYDAARTNWGSSWRLPTNSEVEELKNKCTQEWISINGIFGCRIIGKNGNSIFLPAAGRYEWSDFYGDGAQGEYWTSTPQKSYTEHSYFFYTNSAGILGTGWSHRYVGLSIRPVSD